NVSSGTSLHSTPNSPTYTKRSVSLFAVSVLSMLSSTSKISRFFFFSSRRRHTRSVSAFLLNRSSDLNLGNLLLLGKIGVFHNRRNASSRLLLLISKHLILCIYLVFRILA